MRREFVEEIRKQTEMKVSFKNSLSAADTYTH